MSQKLTKRELEVLLDKAVDSLSQIMDHGPDDSIELSVPMYIHLDKLYIELMEANDHYLKAIGKQVGGKHV